MESHAKYKVINNDSNCFEIGEIVRHMGGNAYVNGSFVQYLSNNEVMKVDEVLELSYEDFILDFNSLYPKITSFKGESNMSEYKVGNIVRIKDPGMRYTTYVDWFKENGLGEYEWEYSNKKCNGESKGMLGVVKGVGKHRESDVILIYIELNNGNVILIGEDGVERPLKEVHNVTREYKVGDRVRIKESLEIGEYYGVIQLLEPPMADHRGEYGTIIRTQPSIDIYLVKIDDSPLLPYYWDSNMLEPAEFKISVDGISIGTISHGNLNASDFHSGVINSKEECKMDFTKDDLRTGMVLEPKDGQRMKVMLNTEYGDIVTWDSNTWTELHHYNYDLTRKLGNNDIIKVYNPKAPCYIKTFDDEKLELIWEREEAKYYLYSDHLDDYLNYNVLFDTFSISDSIESTVFKTKFTDAEIEKLEIPVDNYEKIKC